MKSYALCPVSVKRINESVARSNGIFTVLLLVSFLVTKSIVPVIFLALDFLLRSSDLSNYSPLAFLSKGIIAYFGMSNNFINAGPKIFAARIGLAISGLIIIASVFNYPMMALSLTGILGLFSFLEAAFGVCVACEIYPFVYRFLYKEKFQRI